MEVYSVVLVYHTAAHELGCTSLRMVFPLYWGSYSPPAQRRLAAIVHSHTAVHVAGSKVGGCRNASNHTDRNRLQPVGAAAVAQLVVPVVTWQMKLVEW